jgi:hypothetical protein
MKKDSTLTAWIKLLLDPFSWVPAPDFNKEYDHSML